MYPNLISGFSCASVGSLPPNLPLMEIPPFKFVLPNEAKTAEEYHLLWMNSGSRDYLFAFIDASIGKCQYRKALEVITTELSKKPRSMDLRFQQCRLLNCLDRFKESVTICESILQESPYHLSAWILWLTAKEGLVFNIISRKRLVTEAYKRLSENFEFEPHLVHALLSFVNYTTDTIQDTHARLEEALQKETSPIVDFSFLSFPCTEIKKIWVERFNAYCRSVYCFPVEFALNILVSGLVNDIPESIEAWFKINDRLTHDNLELSFFKCVIAFHQNDTQKFMKQKESFNLICTDKQNIPKFFKFSCKAKLYIGNYFEKLTNKPPELVKEMAILCLEVKEYDFAYWLFYHNCNKCPKDYLSWANAGLCYAYKKQNEPEVYKSVKGIFDNTLKIARASPNKERAVQQVRMFYGQCLTLFGHHHEAIDQIKLAEDNDMGDRLMGQNYCALKRFEEAKKYLLESVKKNRLNAFSWDMLGCINVSLGEFKLALDAFKEAIGMRPLDPLFKLNRATAFEKLHQPQFAWAELEIIRLLGFESPHFWQLRGLVAMQLNKTTDSYYAYKAYFATKPENPEIDCCMNYARAAILECKNDEAYYTLVTIRPTTEAHIRDRLDMMLALEMESNNIVLQLSTLTNYLSRYQDSPAHYRLRADFFIKEKKLGKAAQDLRRSLDIKYIPANYRMLAMVDQLKMDSLKPAEVYENEFKKTCAEKTIDADSIKRIIRAVLWQIYRYNPQSKLSLKISAIPFTISLAEIKEACGASDRIIPVKISKNLLSQWEKEKEVRVKREINEKIETKYEKESMLFRNLLNKDDIKAAMMSFYMLLLLNKKRAEPNSELFNIGKRVKSPSDLNLLDLEAEF